MSKNFIDEIELDCKAGDGGSGCASFRREKYVAFGGPNGGDGGNGGSIYLKAKKHFNSFQYYRSKRKFKAKNGESGQSKECYGKSGLDLEIEVPMGTKVYAQDTNELIADLRFHEHKVVVAKGGNGGLGNMHFKSSRNRAPREFTPGKLGEHRKIRLELELLADVGLLGAPNAGKSTLLSKITAAKPKIANYAFTTLEPQLGIASIDDWQSFVVADIPGLIEGASAGIGLGSRFLRHLSRTKLLLHIVDIADRKESPLYTIQTVLRELQQFRSELYHKPRWLVFNKCELLEDDELKELSSFIIKELNWNDKVFYISGATGDGCKQLCKSVYYHLNSEDLY